MRTKTKRIKIPSTAEWVKAMADAGISQPSEMKAEFEEKYPSKKPKTLEAYIMACGRQGLTKAVRDAKAVNIERQEVGKHILDYEEVKKYEFQAAQSGVQQLQINRQKQKLVAVWNLCGKTDPHTWTYETVLAGLAKQYKFAKDERTGAYQWEKRGAISKHLSAVNTMFPTVMAKGWSSRYNRKDNLKDYFTFDEVQLFTANLCDVEGIISMEGATALFLAQINLGCREGSTTMTGDTGNIEARTGILSLSWDDVDYHTRRCSLHEKGGKGNAARVWNNLPLDLFPWLKGWDALMRYHVKTFGYFPTNNKHESGPCFKLSYNQYRDVFTDTRKRCNGRIAGEKETFTPHILRKTHAQWLVKLYVPLEQICGQFPEGYFGVGWDNPQILMKYYVTLESEQRDKAAIQAHQRMIKLGLIEGEIEKDPKDVLIENLTIQIKELTAIIANGARGPVST